MEIKGENYIAAQRAAVWTALNDPAVLARCIDGVEALVRTKGDDGVDRFEGKMNARVGPVRATFTGSVTVTDPEPPHRYRLVGEGKGGVAGFAKGEAAVVLEPDGDGTLLSYTVTSSVGGKLAQLGSRLIEGTAKAYATTFFERFKAEVEGPPPVVEAAVEAPVEAPAPVVPERGGIPPLVWGGVLVILVAILLAWQLS
jgi:carbon monoxide dehydrogenase subunit G